MWNYNNAKIPIPNADTRNTSNQTRKWVSQQRGLNTWHKRKYKSKQGHKRKCQKKLYITRENSMKNFSQNQAIQTKMTNYKLSQKWKETIKQKQKEKEKENKNVFF